MKEIKIKELSLESFASYGSYANMLNPECLKLGQKPIEFFRDMVRLNLGSYTIASFSICRVENRPLVVDISEFHSSCGEGNLPLDADILIHVAPASRNGEFPADSIEIFRVPKGTMISLNPGVWHHAPFAADCDYANVLIVLPERTYANDCTVYQIPEDKRIVVQPARQNITENLK